MTEKSRVTSFLLTLFLGPFGLLYINAPWAVAMILLTIVVTITTGIPGIHLLDALASIFVGDYEVKEFNKLLNNSI